MPRAKDAAFNASNDRSGCLHETREEVLRALRTWASDPTAKQVFWLNGHAGSGKSTIAQSFAESLFVDGQLGASFFCSRDSEARSSKEKIFSTLAFQLAITNNSRSSMYRKHLLEIINADLDVGSRSLREQLEHLIVRPLNDTKSDIVTVVVVDALDECRDEETTSSILSVLSGLISRVPSLKFFITGRPESHIRSGFRLTNLNHVTETKRLHAVDRVSVDRDIRLFLSTKLPEVVANRSDISLPQVWPTTADIEELTAKSAGLFIFAATVVKFVASRNVGRGPDELLKVVLEGAAPSDTFTSLDKLYLDILNDSFRPSTNKKVLLKLRSALGLLSVTFDALSLRALGEILEMSTSGLKTLLRSLHSVIFVPDTPAEAIRFFHKSFPDFLTDGQRCKDKRFSVDLDQCHLSVAESCFKLMSAKLKKNICGLPRYSVNSDLTPEQRDKCISEATRYSCCHWADHLLSDKARSSHLTAVGRSLTRFASTQQLWYFEVLGLLRELRRAVESLNAVHEWLITVCIISAYLLS